MIVAGVLSGTSLDGIDVGIVDLRPSGAGYTFAMLDFATLPFASGLRARLVAAMPPHATTALEVSALHADVGEAFGEAVCALAGDRHVDLVASHGITLAHDGAAHQSLQIGDAFRIRERVGATVAYDFRSADTAAGGHGAPLVPYLDALLFGRPGETRVALNLGGIANLTIVADGAAALAFDSGPANLPLDTYVRMRALSPEDFDRDGALARTGTVDTTLLARWLADPYFSQPPPKSTGRERFGDAFIATHGAALDRLAPSDALATLAALSVRTVADAVHAHAPDARMLIVSGGGARNPVLLDGLRAALPGTNVVTTADFGLDPDAKEALLFAVLGYELLRGRAANVPKGTGAVGPRILGALAPYVFDEVTAVVRREEER
jgi:anhydro-N-acetylmuramic acid kinase